MIIILLSSWTLILLDVYTWSFSWVEKLPSNYSSVGKITNINTVRLHCDPLMSSRVADATRTGTKKFLKATTDSRFILSLSFTVVVVLTGITSSLGLTPIMLQKAKFALGAANEVRF